MNLFQELPKKQITLIGNLHQGYFTFNYCFKD